ncbi:MAG: hypothetical protein HC933_16085 [Pleurocapsa sp. SU_196_0]|nr:hypothetical protein [Pleurocapsa sp. SU_196_0]
MRRAILCVVALRLLVTSCAPVGNRAADLVAPQCPLGYECTRLETGWSITADASKPCFTVGAAQDITGVSSLGKREVRPLTLPDGRKLERRALECNAPNRVTIDTRGQIQVLTLDKAPFRGRRDPPTHEHPGRRTRRGAGSDARAAGLESERGGRVSARRQYRH